LNQAGNLDFSPGGPLSDYQIVGPFEFSSMLAPSRAEPVLEPEQEISRRFMLREITDSN